MVIKAAEMAVKLKHLGISVASRIAIRLLRYHLLRRSRSFCAMAEDIVVPKVAACSMPVFV